MSATASLEFGTLLPTALYRFFGEDGALLYVGITDDLKTRLAAHAAKQPWWGEVFRTTVVWRATRNEALKAEAASIRTEKPRYNIRGRCRPQPLPISQHGLLRWRSHANGRARVQNGATIYSLRIKDGYSQCRFAEVLGMSRRHLRRIEAEASNCRISTLNEIARILHVPVGAITRDLRGAA